MNLNQDSAREVYPELFVDGKLADDFSREPKIFAKDSDYGNSGIYTFRGDNYRSGGAFGTVDGAKSLKIVWNVQTSKLKKGYGSGFWSGSGWTGQPLIPNYSGSRNFLERDVFAATEVVYATMDGNVYFLDLETGEKTRDSVYLGLPFKGAGALHPEFPIGFFGAGDAGPEKSARMVAINLLNCDTLFEFGFDDPLAPRKFHGYDSSPLVYNDTIIEPGENGILYTIKLNTVFDNQTGILGVSPSETVKLRYTTDKSSEQARWLGMEDSAVLFEDKLFIADNGGVLLCIDINTMKILWTANVADDTNASPVLSIEGGKPYLYIGTSLHWQKTGFWRIKDVPVFKFDALTGDKIYTRNFFCATIAGISGGIQSTAALGKGDSEALVFFSVSRTPGVRSGKLVAINKADGGIVWCKKLARYAWSSPVLVSDNNGKTYLLLGTSGGELMLLEATSGKEISTVNLGSNIEATPAVYNDMIVVGTRGQKIFGIKIG